MRIHLQELVPIPLKEKLSARPSGIWNTAATFSRGEWIKIVAPSGTGKTTLMNILYKARHDYEGVVEWDEQDIKNISGDQLANWRQQKISVIFQDLRLFQNLTARENIELNRVMQSPYYETKVVDDMCEMLGIADIAHQKAGVCSYGEQQRIAIVRSLVQPFDWLIMDEPFSHLDNANKEKAASLIASECKKRQAGFVLTDLDEDFLFPYTKTLSL